MDLYSEMRGAPPPDICEIVMNTPNLYALRSLVSTNKISDIQAEKFGEILSARNEGE